MVGMIGQVTLKQSNPVSVSMFSVGVSVSVSVIVNVI